MRKATYLFIKYAPALLAIAGATKFLTWGKELHIWVHAINLVLNIVLIVGFYMAGRTFHYCWKHQSLCRTALWGYAFYAYFLIFDVDKESVYPITLFYVILVFAMCLLYKKL